MTAFDQLVQRKAEEHLNACLAALDAQDAGQPTTSPASAPFCGCNTCVVREILIVTYDLMLTEARREVRAEIEQTVRRDAWPRDPDRVEPHPTEIEDLCDADD